jgi:hypothetical protein
VNLVELTMQPADALDGRRLAIRAGARQRIDLALHTNVCARFELQLAADLSEAARVRRSAVVSRRASLPQT